MRGILFCHPASSSSRVVLLVTDKVIVLIILLVYRQHVLAESQEEIGREVESFPIGGYSPSAGEWRIGVHTRILVQRT